jgi:LmbE family N-acetylglucosaminyl deacetylase
MQRVGEMVEFRVGSAGYPLRRILCLGAHCDDIEIGCGGMILRLLTEDPNIEICWRVFSSTSVRKKEALEGAKLFLSGAKKNKVTIHKFRDRFFPSLQAQIKSEFDKLKKEFAPDVILTHYRHDLHQDHRVINELTWNTFRNHLILEYEIPKYDGDLGTPNFFVGLDRSICQRKAEYILDAYASQRAKQWFTPDTFMALQRLRGIEANCAGGFAEGFHCRKLVW